MQKKLIKILSIALGVGIIFSGLLVPVISTTWYAIMILILIPLMTFALGYFLFHLMEKPVERLRADTDFILNGQLDYPLQMGDDPSLDEIKKAFTLLQEKLRVATEEIGGLQSTSSSTGKLQRERDLLANYFDTLFHSSNHGIFIHDVNGRIRDLNEKACDMLGMLRQELVNTSFLDLYPEDELNKCRRAFKVGPKSGSVRFESRFKHKSGRLLDVEVSSNIVDPRRGVIQSIINDISEQKQVLSALQSSEEKFRSFMETASDLMFITDENGYLVYVNHIMCDVMGYTSEEFVLLNLHELLSDEYKTQYLEIRDLLMPDAEDIMEIAWMKKNGQLIYGELKATGIFDKAGKFEGMRGVFRDITERKRVQESQRLAQLGRLSADVAHELKNQLTVLYTLADLSLMEGTSIEEMRENVQSIYDQCSHINDVVKRLLMFSKPSQGDYKIVDIHQAIELVLNLSSKKFMKEQIQITKNYGRNIPKLYVDEKQMTEVFMNLMHNAAEAMDKGGKIEIKTYPYQETVHIDFIDNGSGIPEDVMRNIFDPFFTTKENGTGLGVSACYGIVKAHGGDLKYTSEVNKGTTASVILPIEKSG